METGKTRKGGAERRLLKMGWGRSPRATGGEPSPPLASAASRRVGPCTRSVVQRSCTGGPGAASASVTPGRRADSERSGPRAPVSPRSSGSSDQYLYEKGDQGRMVGEAGFEPATSASRTLRAKPAALLPDTYPIITGTREQGNAGTRRVAVRRSRSQAVAAPREAGGGEAPRATGGEPSPSLASAASRRVGPCTRSAVQRSCTGGPGAASASVTLGLGVPGNLLWRISGVSWRADSERSGPELSPSPGGRL